MMNRGQRNNNPVNLRFAGQTESTGQDDKGYAIFPDGPSGWRAAHAQIKLDQSRDLTVSEFIHKFAPKVENDTKKYMQFICRELWVTSDTPLTEISFYALVGVMAQWEGYYFKNEEKTWNG